MPCESSYRAGRHLAQVMRTEILPRLGRSGNPCSFRDLNPGGCKSETAKFLNEINLL